MPLTQYPSCVVTIKLTFDESLHIQTVAPPVSVDSAVASPGTTPSIPHVEPLVTARGRNSFISNRVPKKASVELPGYRQAGQFTCDFDFRDLPIDPRVVRAAAVEIYLGTVAPGDFGTGMNSTDADGRRRSILRTVNSSGQRNDEYLQIVGIVDEWSVTHGDTGSVVSMRGRDLRGVLLDTPVNVVPGASNQLLDQVDLSQPIDVVVSQILRFNPLFDDIAVTCNPADWADGEVPAPNQEGVVPRHRRGARDDVPAGRGTPNANLGDVNFWDLITRFCYLVGAIPYFEGTWLRIRPARSIFDQTRGGIDPSIPTPFFGGGQRIVDAVTDADIDPPLAIRRLVYGRDTQQLSFNRRFGGFHRPRVIRTVSVDGSSSERGSNRVLVGRWPPETAPDTTRTTRRSPSGEQSEEEILTIPVAGVSSVSRLNEIARSVFEEVGRGEMGGECETKNLASFGGDNSDPDLVRMRPGDGIEFMVDTRAVTSSPPLVSALTDFARSSFEEAVANIEERIGDEDLARVIVASSRGLIQEVQRFFRVSTVRFTWDAASGVKISFNFQNYVVARNEVETASSAPGEMTTRTVPGAARVLTLEERAITGRAPMRLDEILITGTPGGSE